MKRATLTYFALSACLALRLSTGATAQEKPANQLLKFSFEMDVQRWQAVGTALSAATLKHTTDAGNVHTGKGALQYSYPIKEGERSGAFVGVKLGALANMKTLKICVKPDHNTVLAALLQEREGGRYIGFAYIKADAWNEVAFAPEDFILDTSPDAPKAPKGKLNLAQADSIAIADYSQWLAGVGKGAYQEKLFPYRHGDHTLYIDDVEALTDALPELNPKKGNDTILDSFERPQPSWIPLGSVKTLSIENGKPLSGKSLKIEYQVTPEMFGAASKNLTGSFFTKDDKIGLTVASVKPIRLMLQVEDSVGGRYNIKFNLTGDKEPRELVAAWKEFDIAPDSKTKVSIDPSKIVRVFFMDITGALDTVTQENTLWINNLRSIREK